MEEIDLLDDMYSALVDLLIEKGIITEEEYEKRIKEKVRIKRGKSIKKIIHKMKGCFILYLLENTFFGTLGTLYELFHVSEEGLMGIVLVLPRLLFVLVVPVLHSQV